MKGTLIIALAGLGFMLSGPASAAGAFDAPRGEVDGRTLVNCVLKSNQKWTQEEFEKLFPKFHNYLKARWEAKEVEHVYFLRDVKGGIIFFVNGATPDETWTKANRISDELLGIIGKEKIALKGNCQVLQLGGLWLK